MTFNLNRNYQIRNHQKHKQKRLHRIIDIFVCLLVRLIFVVQAVFCIYVLFSFYGQLYVLLVGLIFVIFFDTAYVIHKRHGKEWTWYSISGFSYTFVVLPLIWNLVYSKVELFDNECEREFPNETNLTLELIEKHEHFEHYWIFKSLSLCQLIEIIVAVFIITCCLARWLFPIKKKLRREALSNLLLSFITNGSDIVEFFSYVDEKEVHLSNPLTLSILIFFTLSSLQFSLTLSAKIETKKGDKKSSLKTCTDLVLGTEIWALILVLLWQDLPFLILRLLILFQLKELQSNYNLYFFVAKNFILVFFELYYIVSIVLEYKSEQKYLAESLKNQHDSNQQTETETSTNTRDKPAPHVTRV